MAGAKGAANMDMHIPSLLPKDFVPQPGTVDLEAWRGRYLDICASLGKASYAATIPEWCENIRQKW